MSLHLLLTSLPTLKFAFNFNLIHTGFLYIKKLNKKGIIKFFFDNIQIRISQIIGVLLFCIKIEINLYKFKTYILENFLLLKYFNLENSKELRNYVYLCVVSKYNNNNNKFEFYFKHKL